MPILKPLSFVAAFVVLAGSSALADDPSAAPAPAASASASPYGMNLVVNGDAESELGAPDSRHIVKPSGWKTTGEFTSVLYGASGGFPDATSPGPKDRGKSLFEGGNVAKSTASQTISLAAYARDLANAKITCTFSAWLGGYSTQQDNAVASVSFVDAAGKTLAVLALGPVTTVARKSITGSLAVEKTGAVPKMAASAVVAITITRFDGTYNDGSIDNVSLVLSKP